MKTFALALLSLAASTSLAHAAPSGYVPLYIYASVDACTQEDGQTRCTARAGMLDPTAINLPVMSGKDMRILPLTYGSWEKVENREDALYVFRVQVYRAGQEYQSPLRVDARIQRLLPGHEDFEEFRESFDLSSGKSADLDTGVSAVPTYLGEHTRAHLRVRSTQRP